MMTLEAARDALRSKRISSVELTRGFVDAIERLNPTLNAYITVTADAAMAQAAAADHRRAAGEDAPLLGLPIANKDLFCTKGVRTTAGSRILSPFVPPYESSVTANLLRDGAVFLGKTNLDEFAMGSSNMTSAYGPVANPWTRRGSNEPLVPGGSSGGSASAVAAGLALAATATDTGGSIRQPASFCGIAGIKPTYGRCSRWGVVAFASSLDQAGPMARDVRDCAILLQVMSGYDLKDSTSLDLAVPDWVGGLTGDLRGVRVGVPREYRLDGMDITIAALWDRGVEWLKAAGASVVDVSLPHTKYALPAYYIIAPAEASSNLARYDGVRYGLRVAPGGGSLAEMYAATRSAGFGPEVKRRIMIGTYVLSAGFYDAYYTQAQKIRTLIAQDFAQAWEHCDVLLTPTAPSAAFASGDKVDPLEMYLNDVFTVPSSLAGLPAMSVPAGLSDTGLPLGLQVIGRSFDEAGVLNAGLAIERAAGFSAQPERWW